MSGILGIFLLRKADDILRRACKEKCYMLNKYVYTRYARLNWYAENITSCNLKLLKWIQRTVYANLIAVNRLCSSSPRNFLFGSWRKRENQQVYQKWTIFSCLKWLELFKILHLVLHLLISNTLQYKFRPYMKNNSYIKTIFIFEKNA